jgi:hypothetical protein
MPNVVIRENLDLGRPHRVNLLFPDPPDPPYAGSTV